MVCRNFVVRLKTEIPFEHSFLFANKFFSIIENSKKKQKIMSCNVNNNFKVYEEDDGSTGSNKRMNFDPRIDVCIQYLDNDLIFIIGTARESSFLTIILISCIITINDQLQFYVPIHTSTIYWNRSHKKQNSLESLLHLDK